MPERAHAQIDLGAIERNCLRIRELVGADTKLCAVVKANVYGHGDAPCAKGAGLAGAADWLAVASAGEAAELRRHSGDNGYSSSVRSRLRALGSHSALTPMLSHGSPA